MVELCTKPILLYVCILAVVVLVSSYYLDIAHWNRDHPLIGIQHRYGNHVTFRFRMRPELRDSNKSFLIGSKTAKELNDASNYASSFHLPSPTHLVDDPENLGDGQRTTPGENSASIVVSDKTSVVSLNLSDLPARTNSLYDAESPPNDGRPIQNIFFLKTHKTGSSTLQNILIRYAYSHNRTVGLPLRGVVFPSYFKGMKMTASELQRIPEGKNVNMIMHHMILNYDVVSSLLPPDTFYFTILRDPATLFKSEFTYFHHHTAAFRRAKNFEDFIKNIKRYYRGKKDGQFWWYSKNPMIFDLGFDNQREDDDYLNSILKKMRDMFDLVLIVEYFDMGLILLKHALRWEMNDILYLSINLQNDSSPGLDILHKNYIYNWNKADYFLYKFYNDTFWKKVESFGKDKMESELSALKKMKDRLADICVETSMIDNSRVKNPKFKLFYRPGVHLLQYQLKKHQKHNETCVGMILPEVQWWNKISEIQANSLNCMDCNRSDSA